MGEEGELETAVTQLEERAARRKRQRKFPVVMDDVEKSVAVPAADSTVALTDEEKHILERLKGSFLFQQPLYPIETVECRGLDDEQTDHSHRHPFMTSWTALLEADGKASGPLLGLPTPQQKLWLDGKSA